MGFFYQNFLFSWWRWVFGNSSFEQIGWGDEEENGHFFFFQGKVSYIYRIYGVNSIKITSVKEKAEVLLMEGENEWCWFGDEDKVRKRKCDKVKIGSWNNLSNGQLVTIFMVHGKVEKLSLPTSMVIVHESCLPCQLYYFLMTKSNIIVSSSSSLIIMIIISRHIL